MCLCSRGSLCQSKMQVDQDEQKAQGEKNGDKKSETDEMEVTDELH